jgi:ArsR family transcriptional regulator
VRQLKPDEIRLTRMLRALGNPTRFQIVKMLAELQQCVTKDIVEGTSLTQSTVSQHLKVLREAGLIQGAIEGRLTYYCLDSAGIRWLKDQIAGWLPGCCVPEQDD